jgi:hypothetical protein
MSEIEAQTPIYLTRISSVMSVGEDFKDISINEIPSILNRLEILADLFNLMTKATSRNNNSF